MKKSSFVLVLSLVACSAEGLDVGEDGAPQTVSGNSGGSGGSGGAAKDAAAVYPLPDWSTVGACPTTGEPAPQFIGTWEGALEDFYLKPLIPLRLVIAEATTDGVCGTLSWGTDTPAPLPLTDPAQTGRDFGFGGGAGFLFEGLSYTITIGAARDETLRFSVSAYEHWQDYCAMQDTFYYSPNIGRYTCIEDYSTIEPREDDCTLNTSHGPVTMPLKQCTACTFLETCRCNATACAASTDPSKEFDLTLDHSVSGAGAIVSKSELAGEQSIHLERVE